ALYVHNPPARTQSSSLSLHDALPIFSFTWTMRAPLDAPEGEIAWNSFAFTSTNAQTGYPLRPAEPNKVGIEIEIPEISPLIELRSEEHTSELQSRENLVCRLLLE